MESVNKGEIMLKIGIIGNGTIAPIHMNGIRESQVAQITCICDCNRQRSIEGVSFYTDIDEMLSSEQIDCVHICLPHYLHVPTVIKCAKKGIHVFVEKPLGLNYEETKSLFDLEEEYGVKIGVSLQNRYNLTTLKLKELIDSKEYGELLGSKGLVIWSRDDAYYEEAPWRGSLELAGSGVMLNQSIHTLDLLSYLGGSFCSVDAKISNFSVKKWEIEDSVMARLEYRDKQAFGVFFATNGYCSNSSVELEFVLEKATFRIKDSSLYQINLVTNESKLLCTDVASQTGKNYYGTSHTVAIKHFYNTRINASIST